MTANAMRLAELPLLGSNQDSPDPESVPTLGSSVIGAKNIPEHTANRPQSTHGFPHGFLHRPRATKAQRRDEEWARICRAFGYRCAYCGKRPPFLHREHMTPVSRGGEWSLENIVPACSRCNTVKGSRTPLEWFLTFTEKKPQKPRRSWPLIDGACRRCGGQRELRTYGKRGDQYTRCVRCRVEYLVEPTPPCALARSSTGGTGDA